MIDIPSPSGPTIASTSDQEATMLAAFWRLVAAQGWQGASMAALARESSLSLAVLRSLAPGKLAVLCRHERAVDQQVLAQAQPALPGSTARDRIFDLLMARLDALQPNRPGIIRLGRDLRQDPFIALALAPQIAASMAWMLEAAEVDTTGLQGALRVKGLVLVWLATLRAWEQDDSQDLGPTMAALDRALDRAEGLARRLRLDGPAAPAAPASPDDGSVPEAPPGPAAA